MEANEYQERALAKEADQKELTEWVYSHGEKATRLQNACRGLADDCGELNGAVKKWLEYQQPLDEVNVLEEIGDCLWRLAQACKAINCTLGDAMQANLDKLEKVRYKDTVCNPVDAAESGRDRAAERQALRESLTSNSDPGIYQGYMCPNCKTHVSDELVRKLHTNTLGQPFALCPECMNRFTLCTREGVDDEFELIAYKEGARENA
jgi:NTP pyrophosphatase (non-canonical NTP hydrolase)/uncharacterized protein YlaI